MPVDKFGSDTKTRDTGVSLTYINNNYIRSDGDFLYHNQDEYEK